MTGLAQLLFSTMSGAMGFGLHDLASSSKMLSSFTRVKTCGWSVAQSGDLRFVKCFSLACACARSLVVMVAWKVPPPRNKLLTNVRLFSTKG